MRLAPILALLALAPINAQAGLVKNLCLPPSSQALQGLYVMAANRLSTGGVDSRTFTDPYVDGFFIKWAWGAIQHSNTGNLAFDKAQYDWSGPDADVATARFYHKHLTVAFFESGLAQDKPPWFDASGAAYYDGIDYTTGLDRSGNQTCGQRIHFPLAWDATYQRLFGNFIAAAGVHYAGAIADGTITGVKLNGVGIDTAEFIFGTKLSGSTLNHCGSLNSGYPVTVPNLYDTWAGTTVNNTFGTPYFVNSTAYYTPARLLDAFTVLATDYKNAFATVPIGEMGGGDGSTPDINASGTPDTGGVDSNGCRWSDYSMCALPTSGRAVLGSRFYLHNNGLKGKDFGREDVIYADIQANIAAGGGGGLQQGVSIYNSSADTGSGSCNMNGGFVPPGARGCNSVDVLIQNLNIPLEWGVRYLEGHDVDLAGLPAQNWQAYKAGCFQ